MIINFTSEAISLLEQYSEEIGLTRDTLDLDIAVEKFYRETLKNYKPKKHKAKPFNLNRIETGAAFAKKYKLKKSLFHSDSKLEPIELTMQYGDIANLFAFIQADLNCVSEEDAIITDETMINLIGFYLAKALNKKYNQKRKPAKNPKKETTKKENKSTKAKKSENSGPTEKFLAYALSEARKVFSSISGVTKITTKLVPTIEFIITTVDIEDRGKTNSLYGRLPETIIHETEATKELELETMLGELSVVVTKALEELRKPDISSMDEEESRPTSGIKVKENIQPDLQKAIDKVVSEATEEKKYAGTKILEGKTMYSLIPNYLEKGISEILTAGAKEYGVNNWQDFKPDKETMMMWYNASRRHMQKFMEYLENPTIKSRYNTKDFGHHHLLHAITDLIFMHWYDTHDLQGDYKIKEG